MAWHSSSLKPFYSIKKSIVQSLFMMIAVFVIQNTYALERLPVPSNLITFNSSLGKVLFARSSNADYWRLSPFFITENGLTFCGVASAVMVLNASGLKAPITPAHAPYRIFDQENFFTQQVLGVVTPAKIGMRGVSLDELSSALETYGLQVNVVHGNEVTESEFRLELSAAMKSDKKYIIINYYRRHVGQEGGGHFSPVAAYDKETDRFLVLDVARYKYPSVWVKTAELYQAVKLDGQGVPFNQRGYLVIENG